jgi:hypothetical protein
MRGPQSSSFRQRIARGPESGPPMPWIPALPLQSQAAAASDKNTAAIEARRTDRDTKSAVTRWGGPDQSVIGPARQASQASAARTAHDRRLDW